MRTDQDLNPQPFGRIGQLSYQLKDTFQGQSSQIYWDLFLAQHGFSTKLCMCTLGKCAFSCSWAKCPKSLNWIHLINVLCKSTFSYCCQYCVKVPYYYCITFIIFLYTHQYFLYIFLSSYVPCIDIYENAVFLLDCYVYRYEKPFVSLQPLSKSLFCLI